MQRHLNQAKLNEEFLKVLDEKFPKDFFDWKVTVCFYCAIHYVRAYVKLKKVRIGENHKELLFHINPKNSNAKLPISEDAYSIYFDLLSASHTSRYNGFLDEHRHKGLLTMAYKSCRENLEELKTYLKSQGLKIPKS